MFRAILVPGVVLMLALRPLQRHGHTDADDLRQQVADMPANHFRR